MKAWIRTIFVVAGLAWTGSLAAQDDDILKNLVNSPHPGAFSVYGIKGKPGVRDDGDPRIGKALRVTIPGKGANAWDISLANPITKPIKAGDQIVLAFYARLIKGENGATSAVLPNNSIQLAKEPYTAFMAAPATIGPEWKMYEVKGRADRDYAAGELGVSLHLATGKQVIDFGPIFVLDMGP
jgi:hypothetical protein